MDANRLRKSFLEYFAGLNHELVASSAVVPKNDPTLLFANAGMNQFKDVFLGNEVRHYTRAASVQKCIRAGGKHNDLDEVGKDGRHLTFFEMLGNWSFGDYGKAPSIAWAWAYLTQTLALPVERLYVSVYKDDDEAYNIWHDEVGLEPMRIARYGDIDKGDEENFWSMGPVGACGPCTEIYIDLRPDEPYAWGPGFPEERYLELWNIVFMQFDRSESGELKKLPMCSVDTGMGLERILSVLQGVESVYETDLFAHIFEATAALLGHPMTHKELLVSENLTAYRVIADHIRTLTFAIAEGQPFSNDGRGYVLRRILRRAVRFGRILGFRGPFLYKISQAVVETFAEAYPELSLVAVQTQEVIRIEEARFFATLERGILRFDEAASHAVDGLIGGREAFMLYDTYGFPLDLTEIMAEERGLKVDKAGFNVALQEQRQRSADGAKFCVCCQDAWTILEVATGCQFLGYTTHEATSRVLRYHQSEDFCEIILAETPFYAESGGEVGDQGTLVSEDKSLVFDVIDTVSCEGGIVHVCVLKTGFVTKESMQQRFIATVDIEYRRAISANHSCTHLLQAALRKCVSTEIYQAGSLVRSDRFRFDFTFPRALTALELQAVEAEINANILDAIEVKKHYDVPIDEAKAMGAMAIFGEKYGNNVRVVEIPGMSIELCGGIHVNNSLEIQTCRILSESAIAAGVRRIEGVTRRGAMEIYANERALLGETRQALGVDINAAILPRIHKMREAHTELERQTEQLNLRLAKLEIENILSHGRSSKDAAVMLYAARIDINDRKALLMYGDLLRDRMDVGVALLGAIIDGKPALSCVVSEKALKLGLNAGKIVSDCAAIIGGKGGGRAKAAQAGGTDPTKLDLAIEHLYVAL